MIVVAVVIIVSLSSRHSCTRWRSDLATIDERAMTEPATEAPGAPIGEPESLPDPPPMEVPGAPVEAPVDAPADYPANAPEAPIEEPMEAPGETAPAAEASSAETPVAASEEPVETDAGPRTVGRLIADALRSAGVRYAFTVPGESFLGLLDVLEDAGIRVIATRHEG